MGSSFNSHPFVFEFKIFFFLVFDSIPPLFLVHFFPKLPLFHFNSYLHQFFFFFFFYPFGLLFFFVFPYLYIMRALSFSFCNANYPVEAVNWLPLLQGNQKAKQNCETKACFIKMPVQIYDFNCPLQFFFLADY